MSRFVRRGILSAATALLASNIALAQQTIIVATPTASPQSPVNALIPWLLQEGRELSGIPFTQVIFAATGRKVLAIDPKNEADQRVIQQLSGVLMK
jgi:hypothetical protein